VYVCVTLFFVLCVLEMKTEAGPKDGDLGLDSTNNNAGAHSYQGNSGNTSSGSASSLYRRSSSSAESRSSTYPQMDPRIIVDSKLIIPAVLSPSQSSALFPVEETWNILLLMVLYTLQGIPMGLSASLPMILKEKGASYSELSLFSMVSMPFSLKLFWAPIVDSVYIPWVGRRKTWLIPSQVVTGIVMILGSTYMNNWMSHGVEGNIAIGSLTMYFTGLYFLMATQDIAVDGWALTILARENVTYASICNTIGQSLGVFIANQSYIALSDAHWCQRFLGASGALVTLSDFMIFWGWVFIVTTVIVCLFKTEKKWPSSKDSGDSVSPVVTNDEPEGLIETFHQTIKVIKIKSVQTLCLLLVTIKVAFAATDSVFIFRLQEVGVSKSDIAAMSTVLVLVGFLVPAVLSNQLSTRPLEILIYAFVGKLVTSVLRWMVVYCLQFEGVDVANVGMTYYSAILTVLVLHEIVGTALFISFMSFFARIADPSIGGTYMTLLNTIANLGSMWPRPLALWMLPQLSSYQCVSKANKEQFVDIVADVQHYCTRCEDAGGKCKCCCRSPRTILNFVINLPRQSLD
jgi:PAT family acetyl-CoA transporter-like MFS transporter 1